ncbi:MAG: CHASE4 domain-containing protein, partial [Bacteroidota bacterium]
MRIRVKIILSICITAMIIILSYVFFLVVKNHRDRLLMESYRQALESGARTAFKVEQKYLTQLTNDYSKWDEMVTFSKTGDSSWSKSNLSTMPGIHRLTKIWVFNLDKKLIYSKSRNGDRGDFSSLFTDSLFAYLSLTRSAYFFYKQNNRVYEISVSTIHPTQDTLGRLPPFGFFMICRLVDKTMLQDLEEVSGSTVTSLAQPETRTKKANLSEIIFVIPLPGWNNKPVGYLELSKYNPMLRSYLEITNATGIFYFILALVLLISVAFALYRWLNYPLKKIAESLALESSEKIKAMAVKKNEFGEIALMIERFFEQKKELAAIIQEKNGVLASLSDAESKNRAILSAIPDHLFRINLFGVITDFHINKTDDFIPDTRLVIGKNFEEVVPQHIVPMLQRAIQVVNSQKL